MECGRSSTSSCQKLSHAYFSEPPPLLLENDEPTPREACGAEPQSAPAFRHLHLPETTIRCLLCLGHHLFGGLCLTAAGLPQTSVPNVSKSFQGGQDFGRWDQGPEGRSKRSLGKSPQDHLPRTGSELPNFQAGDHGSPEPR